MNPKLAQALALSSGTKSPQIIKLDEPPMLEGPRQDQIQRFNEAFKDWVRRQEIRLSQQIISRSEPSSTVP